jgi:antitoxin component of MazEF toxin-antitoxin module
MFIKALRRITTIGNSLGVTLPRELLRGCGLTRGRLVEIQRVGTGLLIVPARPLPSPDSVLQKLKAGLVRIYGDRFKGAYVYDSSALDVSVLVVLDDVHDYGAEIEVTSALIAELSLASSLAISRVFLGERDWARHGRAPMRPL